MHKTLSTRSTEKLIKFIKNKLNSNNINAGEIKSGVSCLFMPISKTVAIKAFIYQNERDHSYNVQKDLCKKSFAPKVGRRFCFSIQTGKEFTKNVKKLDLIKYNMTEKEFCTKHNIFLIDKITFYCYETENVNVASSCISEYKFDRIYFNYIYDKLIEYGFLDDDIHIDNMGFKNGKPIWIDCAYTEKYKVKNNYVYCLGYDSPKWKKLMTVRNFKQTYSPNLKIKNK